MVMIQSKARSISEDKVLLTDAEIESCVSVADAIRKCIKKHPNVSNGTIARFISKHHNKEVRVQWVYNVRNQKLKRG